jgi:hypothetical protein
MAKEHPALAQAEHIAREAKRGETERLVDQCERSEDRTLRSLADLYRKLNFGYY